MAKLKIDLDRLDVAMRDYESAITGFKNAMKNLEKAMNALKASGWVSNASTAYFRTYEENWKVIMQHHIQIIEHLRYSCLGKAKTEYQQVYQELGNLKNLL
jgi:uncharacterized protein YukE